MYVYHDDNETGAVQLSPSEIVTCIYRTTPTRLGTLVSNCTSKKIKLLASLNKVLNLPQEQ